mgnify:CR=1 FL=1
MFVCLFGLHHGAGELLSLKEKEKGEKKKKSGVCGRTAGRPMPRKMAS